MICIAVTSVQKKNFKECLKPFRLLKKYIGDIEFIIAKIYLPKYFSGILSVFYESLCKFILKRKGAEVILKSCFDPSVNNVIIPLSGKYMQNCITEITNDMQHANDAIYIKDEFLSNINYDLLANVCMNAKFIFLITNNTNKAEGLCDKLYFEYGIYPEIYDNNYKIPYNARTVINIDESFIKYNYDKIIDGVMLEHNLCELNIDIPYLIKIYPQIIEILSFKSWMSGKNQLTRTLS